MQIYRDIRQVSSEGPVYLTIGNFDGLHLGHQALIERLQHEARQEYRPGTRTALMTFDPHPLAVLRPGISLQLLTSPIERVQLAGELGIDIGIVQSFTKELANLSPFAFMQRVQEHLNVACLIAGPDFALGRNRVGTVDVLHQIGRELGYSVVVLDAVVTEGQEVRSVVVRDMLQSGRVDEASSLLGRNYRLSGVVEEGDRRGHAIGVPTANIRPPAERMVPANGVYATWTWIGKPGESPRFASATNIGVRPTIEDDKDGVERQVESHLLDFPSPGRSDNLYGQVLTIEFVSRLRDEKRFDDLDQLVNQIQKDIEQTRGLLSTSESAAEDEP